METTMTNEMQELASWTIKKAKAAGADACRVNINAGRNVSISYRERKPESIKEASTKGLSIDIFVNRRYSSQNTSDLRRGALEAFVVNAVEATKLLAEDPYRSLPDPKYYEGRSDIDLGLVDPSYDELTPEERHAVAKVIENTCLKEGGEKTVSVTSSVSDGKYDSLLMTSNGFTGKQQMTYFNAGAQMTLRDEGNRRPNGYHFVGGVKRRTLPAAEEIGAEAARRTFDLLGGKKMKTETLPVIIENRVVSTVLNGLLAGMYGRNIQQKQSFLADKRGETIGSPQLTMIDDPFVPGGLGSKLFDGDGFAARKRTMIEKGVLKEFYVDWYYSRKLGWEPTTSGPSNLVIPPGMRSVAEIMKSLDRGIFITGFIGGNSNSTTGDASVGIYGHLFEHGKPTQAVAEMNIAGNHLQVWHKLAEVANDPWPYSSWRTPSLVLTDIVVSGV
jgi:PmbA protein